MYQTLLLCLSVTMAPARAVTVTTSYGPVSGQTVDVDNGRDVTSVDVFLGIPYAQDTSGSNRFKVITDINNTFRFIIFIV